MAKKSVYYKGGVYKLLTPGSKDANTGFKFVDEGRRKATALHEGRPEDTGHILVDDKPRKGDMFRVKGKTFKVRSTEGTKAVAYSRGDKVAMEKPMETGSIIFRWIGGHVVPIRVKG